MGPVSHAVLSCAVGGGVWVTTGSAAAASLALGVGVLIDLDHLYDFYQWYIRGKGDRVYVLFHGWEYSLAGLLALALGLYHPLLLAAVLAHLVHVAADHWHNGLSRFSYSITYRAMKGFQTAYICPHKDITLMYQKLPRMVPFGGRLVEPWFRRKVQPWFDRRVNGMSHARADASYPSDG